MAKETKKIMRFHEEYFPSSNTLNNIKIKNYINSFDYLQFAKFLQNNQILFIWKYDSYILDGIFFIQNDDKFTYIIPDYIDIDKIELNVVQELFNKTEFITEVDKNIINTNFKFNNKLYGLSIQIYFKEE